MFASRRDTNGRSYLAGLLGITAFGGAAYPLLVRYGVCGGFVLSLVIAGLCAVAGKLRIVRGVAQRRPIRPLMIAALSVLSLAIGSAVGWAAAREPSPEGVFRDDLKMNMPPGISDARACVRWVFADPAYYVRFRAGRETIEQLAWDLKLHSGDSLWRLQDTHGLGGAPTWWKPSELREPNSWRSSGGDPFVYLYADLELGIAYMVLVHT